LVNHILYADDLVVFSPILVLDINSF